MRTILMIAAAGAFGALSRYGISAGVSRFMGAGFAYGTLCVNVIGCFLLGLVMHIAITTDTIPHHWRMAICTGFLGALTTFSTFSYETVRYLDDGSWGLAGANIAANLLLGGVATVGGIILGRVLFGGV
jgi:CrcB protein